MMPQYFRHQQLPKCESIDVTLARPVPIKLHNSMYCSKLKLLFLIKPNATVVDASDGLPNLVAKLESAAILRLLGEYWSGSD